MNNAKEMNVVVGKWCVLRRDKAMTKPRIQEKVLFPPSRALCKRE